MTLPFEPGPADRMLQIIREHEPFFSPKVSWLRLVEQRFPGVDLELEAHCLMSWLEGLPPAQKRKRKVTVRFVSNWLSKVLPTVSLPPPRKPGEEGKGYIVYVKGERKSMSPDEARAYRESLRREGDRVG